MSRRMLHESNLVLPLVKIILNEGLQSWSLGFSTVLTKHPCLRMVDADHDLGESVERKQAFGIILLHIQ